MQQAQIELNSQGPSNTSSFKLVTYVLLIPFLFALSATSAQCQESYEENREELMKRLEYAGRLRVGVAHYQDLLKQIDQTREQITWLDNCDTANPINKEELKGNGEPLARIRKLRAQLEEQIKAIETADFTDLPSEILFKLNKTWKPPDTAISIKFEIDKAGKFGKFKLLRFSFFGPDLQILQSALSQIVLSKFSRSELPAECEFSSQGYNQSIAIGKPGASRKFKFAFMKTPCFKP